MSAARVLVGDEAEIIVTESCDAQTVVKLALEPGVTSVVQRDSRFFLQEISFAKILQKQAAEFMVKPLDFVLGLHGDEAAHLPTLTVVSSADEKKTTTMAMFEMFVSALQGARTIQEDALMIADELYTNASKNAWAAPWLANRDQPGQAGRIEFFARADGQRLVFGCRDSFGRLDIDQVLGRVQKCFEHGVANAIVQGQGGAGIGSFMVFNACMSYYAGVESGKATVVCVALPLGLSKSEASAISKNIHMVVI